MKKNRHLFLIRIYDSGHSFVTQRGSASDDLPMLSWSVDGETHLFSVQAKNVEVATNWAINVWKSIKGEQ